MCHVLVWLEVVSCWVVLLDAGGGGAGWEGGLKERLTDNELETKKGKKVGCVFGCEKGVEREEVG